MLRLLGYLFGLGTVAFVIVAAAVAVYVGQITQDLPDYEVLAQYEPPVTTRVHSVDGRLMGEYARERRLFLPIQAVPDMVKAAFLSAEDKNFYSHSGVDFLALARAMVTNVEIVLQGQNRRLLGGSTITQQVAKNFLLTSARTVDRKVQEAILAFRIEQAYSKDRILELYLNEIFFGSGSHGIAAAALTYFGKAVNELSLHEAAYLAALPKAPSNYHPFNDTEAALDRRNWILDRMVENGYITTEEAETNKAKDLGVNFRRSGETVFASEYFTEEVRKLIVERYGEDALYEGGLSVRTTLDPQIQNQARVALQNALIDFDQSWGWRGPIGRIDLGGDWGPALAEFDRLADVPEWDIAVVLAAGADGLRIGLRPERVLGGGVTPDRDEGTIAADDMQWAFRLRGDNGTSSADSIEQVVAVGDVIYVRPVDEDGARYFLRQVPAVSGALVTMDPNTGRVLAMAGGFSFHDSQFNRATQAFRQPGSSFKPFVYAAALDNGYTPASVIMDAPIQLVAGGEVWEPKNFDGSVAGPSTLRLGIEKSRNLMTVRLAQDMGMNLVSEYAEQFGLYDDLSPVLAMSLGSGETTVLRMVSAYAVFANGGRQIQPSLIDRIQDRYGRTIYKQDSRGCEACNATQWLGQDEPQLVDTREIVLDPMTAYQITSMMEGVVQRGTATALRELGRPIAGKTGTTNDYKDAWFVGYTPTLVTGVYIGFDQPTEMGRGSTGGGLAAPVFKDFMASVLEQSPLMDFQLPQGMTLIEIDRNTGMRANGTGEIIVEAFKPGTGPADSYFVIGAEQVAIQVQQIERQRRISPEAQQAVQQGSGGLF